MALGWPRLDLADLHQKAAATPIASSAAVAEARWVSAAARKPCVAIFAIASSKQPDKCRSAMDATGPMDSSSAIEQWPTHRAGQLQTDRRGRSLRAGVRAVQRRGTRRGLLMLASVLAESTQVSYRGTSFVHGDKANRGAGDSHRGFEEVAAERWPLRLRLRSSATGLEQLWECVGAVHKHKHRTCGPVEGMDVKPQHDIGIAPIVTAVFSK